MIAIMQTVIPTVNYHFATFLFHLDPLELFAILVVHPDYNINGQYREKGYALVI